jgi:hypothetical protein
MPKRRQLLYTLASSPLALIPAQTQAAKPTLESLLVSGEIHGLTHEIKRGEDRNMWHAFGVVLTNSTPKYRGVHAWADTPYEAAYQLWVQLGRPEA